MLEDSLREMFAARVESAPSTQRAADRAVRRGRAIRRRRAAASSLAAALALTVTVGTTSMLGGWWRLGEGGQPSVVTGFNADPARTATAGPERTPPTPGPENDIGLDLRVGDQLWTSDGRQLRLTGVGQVARAYRVPSGWVYGGATSVRLLRHDGTSVSLSGDDDRWVLSPDGDQIAFIAGTVLYVADLRPTGLAVRGSLDVPPTAAPVAFVGDRVAVSVAALGFDVLDPVQRYTPAWNPQVVDVYGSHGETVAGLVRSTDQKKSCVAELTRTDTGLQPARTGGCDLAPSGSGPPARLAPGGDLLAVPGTSTVDVVDLGRALRGQNAVAHCPVRTVVTPAWADARTLVAADDRGVVRCRTDGAEQVVKPPEGIGTGWDLVPRLTFPIDAG